MFLIIDIWLRHNRHRHTPETAARDVILIWRQITLMIWRTLAEKMLRSIDAIDSHPSMPPREFVREDAFQLFLSVAEPRWEGRSLGRIALDNIVQLSGNVGHLGIIEWRQLVAPRMETTYNVDRHRPSSVGCGASPSAASAGPSRSPRHFPRRGLRCSYLMPLVISPQENVLCGRFCVDRAVRMRHDLPVKPGWAGGTGEMGMARKIGKCTACKRTVARDYTDTITRSRGTGMYRRDVRIAGRLVGARFIEADRDAQCPACGEQAWHGQMVQGFTTEHACDARCTDAKGFRCECSCGGQNHGRGLLLCEAA